MPSADHPRALALLGAGYWGKNLARNFHTLGALHTLCDTNPTTLAAYGADYANVQKTTDPAPIWSDPAIAQVAIAAPAPLHYALARKALESGKDVFVEKPLCLEAHDAEELVAFAEANGRVLMVGHLLQYHPCILKLLALLAQGELGKLHYITSNRLNLGKIRSEENALWSFAPHDISVILSLAGNQLPTHVRCTGGEYLNQGIADTTPTSLLFAHGVRSHIYVTWLNPFKEQKLVVVGSNGMAVFDDTRPWKEKLILHRHYLTWTNGSVPTPTRKNGEFIEVAESEPLRNECQHFLDCCRDRRPPRTDAREGLRVLQVLQAAQHSLEHDGEAARPEDRGRKTEVTGQSSEVSGQATGVGGPVVRPPPSVVAVSPTYFVHPTAIVDDGAVIGAGTKIWHFSHVMKGAQIGERCILGQNVNVDGGTKLGNNVKVQNNVSLYTGVEIEDDVFLGPSCVLTNVTNPRSQVVRHSLYEKTLIRRGATVGANATIVCGVTIGRYAFIAAGAVVTKDVPDYALMIGNPARHKAWFSRHGHVLRNPSPEGIMTCPESSLRYKEDSPGILKCLDLDEDTPLPQRMAVGSQTYDHLKLAG